MRLLVASVILLFSVTGLAEKTPPAQPINVNTATAEELQQLPGIGPSIAKAIVHHRTRNGPFRRIEELLIVRGMSRKKLKRLRPHLTISSTASQASPYAGQQNSAVRGLTAQEIDDLLNGRGMGLARPRHVLELKAQLALTAAQTERTDAIFREMDAAARELGRQVVDQEKAHIAARTCS